MKKAIFLFLSISVVTGSYYYLSTESKDEQNEIIKKVPKQKPNDEHYKQRAYPSGKINHKAFYTALADKKMDKSLRQSQSEQWKLVGPTNIEGRITDIEITEDNPSKLYVAAASGGIFKSEDNGVNWNPIFDNQDMLSIGDMALYPTNNEVIYVGTGEANAGGGSLAYDGNGVYKSLDGGNNWTHLGLDSVGSIGKVLVHPTDSDIAYVGAMGYLFENNSNRGVYKTTDGGVTWNSVFFKNDSTGVIDMAIHPTNPDTVYAATWERIRRVDRRSYGGASSGIFKSTDGGTNWVELTNGLPTEAGRIGITISPSSPNILFAFYTHETSGNIKGVYKSVDNGDNWTAVSTAGLNDVPYMWWFGKIYIDPNVDSTVYIAGFDMHKSVDGGNSWTTIFSGTHADQHALVVDPNNPNRLIIGNDGGAFESLDGGTNYTKLDGLPITQFYTCEIDEQNPDKILGGSQDNGTLTATNSLTNWTRIFGGDGFRVLVDPTNSSNIYAEAQYGYLGRSTNGGANFYVGTNGINSNDRQNWNTPVVFDPSNSSTLYYGSQKLYKSTNKAVSWQAISGDLTGNPTQNNLTYGTITTISASKPDGNILWVGTDNGKVQTTKDGGASWDDVSSNLPNRWVTSVTAHPEEKEKAYVTFSGYRWNENIGHIYTTEDGGNTWTDISGDLPDVPINDFIITPINGTFYVATDIGVYYSINFGANWILFDNGLPNVVITDLRFHRGENKLIAATFGRGIYEVDVDISNNISVKNENKENQLSIYPNPFVDKITIDKAINKVEFIDVNGKIVLKSNENTIETSPLIPGVYWIKIIDTDNVSTVQKVIKR